MDPEAQRQNQDIWAILAGVARSQAAADARMDRWEERMKRAETRMDRADARMDRWEERMNRTDARLDRGEARADKLEARFEKRMKGFEKVVQIGMKESVRLNRVHRETDEKLNALIDSQQRTEEMLRTFMRSLRKSSNGN